jgi:hypothetical protein
MDRDAVSGRNATCALAAGWIALAVACAASTGPAGSPTPTVALSPAGGPTEVWLAVYDTAADPQDLAAERAQILSALGEALAGVVVISPAGCFEGLSQVDPGSYVLALQQTERVYVRALAEQLDGHPRFAEVTAICTD